MARLILRGRRATLAGVGLLAAGLTAGGCKGQDPAPEVLPPGMASRPTVPSAPTVPTVPVATSLRDGHWHGGPQAVSGKLLSGISLYHRVGSADADRAPAHRRAVRLILRFENVTAANASVDIRPGDGDVTWPTPSDGADKPAREVRRWLLRPDQASQLSVDLLVPAEPPGRTSAVVFTRQNGRTSAHEIDLPR